MAGMNNSQRVLLQGEKRFDLQKQLADTLQGRIYSATDRNTGEYCIVKETWKQLARMGRSRDGHKIPEDFLKGEAIMSYLSHCNCNHLNDSPHPGFKKILDKWEDEHCYFVAIQGCRGGELFQYIKDQHTKGLLKSWATTQSQTIQKPLKQDNEWTLMVKILFRQIVDTVAWIHSNGVCHLDLSLDNIMIHNRRTKHVKIICIGELGKYFGKDNLLKMMPRKYDNECAKTNYSAIDESQLDFTCNRRVGKTGYMAPEVRQLKIIIIKLGTLMRTFLSMGFGF